MVQNAPLGEPGKKYSPFSAWPVVVAILFVVMAFAGMWFWPDDPTKAGGFGR